MFCPALFGRSTVCSVAHLTIKFAAFTKMLSAQHLRMHPALTLHFTHTTHVLHPMATAASVHSPGLFKYESFNCVLTYIRVQPCCRVEGIICTCVWCNYYINIIGACNVWLLDVVFKHTNVGFCVRTCFRNDDIKGVFYGPTRCRLPARRLRGSNYLRRPCAHNSIAPVIFATGCCLS